MSNLAKRFSLYSKLVGLYPAPYRERYGEQMLQTLADMLDNAPTKLQQARIWTRLVVDFPLSLAHQQTIYLGGIMIHETPKYVRRNALIGATMLVPFASALIANSADKAINNRTLFHSWLWSMPTLAIWVLWLPLVAAAIALATLGIFLLQRSKAQHISLVKAAFDIQHNWPLLAVGLAGLFILAVVFFHDSVHCVTGNPVREVRNLHATWQCILQR